MPSVLGFTEKISARFPDPSARCVDTYGVRAWVAEKLVKQAAEKRQQ
jgi:hypothetical protein